MAPGSSIKDLVPESPNEKEDGITQITFGQLFKQGTAEYTRVGATGLKDAPPLPTGYVLFKDLAFRVKTEAIIAGFQLTVFSVPSAENETDFGKLSVLHLEDDEMSPANRSWSEVTVLPRGWNEQMHFVSKAQYEALQPNFKLRQLAAVTYEFGIFAIASAPQSAPERAEPFPEVTLKAMSSPEPVQAGEEVTHTITLTNNGTGAAAEVNIKEVLRKLDYVSATPNQGVCKQKGAANVIVCHLGVLPGGASATITVVSRSRQEWFPEDTTIIVNSISVVFKQRATDLVDARGRIQMQRVTSTIVNKH